MKLCLRKDFVARQLEDRATELKGKAAVAMRAAAKIMHESTDNTIIGVDDDPLED